MSEPRCSCGGPPAIIVSRDGQIVGYLCHDCNVKDELARALELHSDLTTFNLLASQWNSGIGAIAPIAPVRVPPLAIPIGSLNMGNVSVRNSNVGVINTGTINRIDKAVGMLREQGAGEVAAAIDKLKTALEATSDADPALQNEIAEHLSVLADEAIRPRDERRHFFVGRTLLVVSTLVGGLAGIDQLWAKYEPILTAWFSPG